MYPSISNLTVIKHALSHFILQPAMGLSSFQPSLQFAPHPLLLCSSTIWEPRQPPGSFFHTKKAIFHHIFLPKVRLGYFSIRTLWRASSLQRGSQSEMHAFSQLSVNYRLTRPAAGNIEVVSFIVQTTLWTQLALSSVHHNRVWVHHSLHECWAHSSFNLPTPALPLFSFVLQYEQASQLPLECWAEAPKLLNSCNLRPIGRIVDSQTASHGFPSQKDLLQRATEHCV